MAWLVMAYVVMAEPGADMHVDICTDTCIDMCFDTCLDTCKEVHGEVCTRQRGPLSVSGMKELGVSI